MRPVFGRMAVAFLLAIAPHTCFSQAWNGQYRYANPMGDSLMWLTYPQIQKELEIVPEQKEKLDKLRTEVQAKIPEIYKLLSEGDATERQKKYFEASQKLGEETEKQVREIVLPHQTKRLGQIMLQMKLANASYGSAAALSGDELAKSLGLTDDQKEQLKKKEEELRTELQEKTKEFYKKLNDDAREKLFSVLTPAQRAQVQELIGEKFEWQATAWPQGQGGVGGIKVEKK